jgi:hypothetical protein
VPFDVADKKGGRIAGDAVSKNSASVMYIICKAKTALYVSAVSNLCSMHC